MPPDESLEERVKFDEESVIYPLPSAEHLDKSNLNWQYVKPLQDPNAIAQLASEAGVKLSADIIADLREHNGGRPDKKTFDTVQTKERALKAFLSFNEDDKGSAFVILDALKKEQPGLLPFASDPGGDYVCITTEGKVVLWLHETNEVEAVANSFSEFLSALYAQLGGN
jgi:cell wall assembly regulator SMI1